MFLVRYLVTSTRKIAKMMHVSPINYVCLSKKKKNNKPQIRKIEGCDSSMDYLPVRRQNGKLSSKCQRNLVLTLIGERETVGAFGGVVLRLF